jgi:hypothetical protein
MRIRSVALLAFILMPLPIMASTTYTYTGNDLGFGGGPPTLPYTTSDFLSGWFTVNTALADSTKYTATQLEADGLSFSFSDGVTTYSGDTNILFGTEFTVWTDLSGDVSNWIIEINNPSTEGRIETSPSGDIIWYDYLLDAYAAGPGTWSSNSTPTTPIPEPSSIVLLMTGTVSLAGMARRRFRRQ